MTMKTAGGLIIAALTLLTELGSHSSGANQAEIVAAQTQLGRFVNNGDGTVTDTRTGLMWAFQDNGSDVTWDDANEYCINYAEGGYSDWRMPTIAELMSLYDETYSRTGKCSAAHHIHITPLIDLSCFRVWSSEQKDSSNVRSFGFSSGSSSTGFDIWENRTHSCWHRALPVRSAHITLAHLWRFIDNGDGTVTDTVTGLMWAAKGNDGDIKWDDAVRYCKNFRGGGYADWRMPTTRELVELFDKSHSLIPDCGEKLDIHIVPSIYISCYEVWSSGPDKSLDPWKFDFNRGVCFVTTGSFDLNTRAVPVRSVKK